MDYATQQHFYRWMANAVDDDDAHIVEFQIFALLRDHPDLIEAGRSWPELRALAASYPKPDDGLTLR